MPGAATTAFYAMFGLALVAGATALLRERRWSRAPLVLTQLLGLGLAWSARVPNLVLAIVLGVTALVVLVVLLLPSTTAALSDDG